MNRRRMLIYVALLIVGVAGARWVADRSANSSLHDYAAQNAERKRQRAESVELSEQDFSKYVEYAFLFSVKEDEEGTPRVRLQAGVCLASERAKAGHPSEAWTVLVAKATVDMAMGAQVSTSPDAPAEYLDDPNVQNVLNFGEFESMTAAVGAFRERIATDTEAGVVPSSGTDAALEYAQELRAAFVKELTSHPEFKRELRAHLQRVSEDTNYPLPSIKWVN